MRLVRLRSSHDISSRQSPRLIAAGLFSALLASCGGGGGGGGGPATYTVSVTVANLQAGTSVVLLNNGADSLTVSANGTIAFAKPIPSDGAYSVTVATQPTGQTCNVSLGSGTVSSFNINVAVSCSLNSYQIGGKVSGLLTGNTVVLQNNSANNTSVSANGTFTFSSPVLSGSAYAVRVSTQPPGENCAVTNGSGTVVGANISSVTVMCVALPYTISATVTGLANVTGLSLQDNGSDKLAVSASGTYSFNTQILSGATYSVTISTQPPGHTCSVQDGSGTVAGSSVTVVVVCPWHVGYGPSSQGVFAYYIDQASGAITALLGNPFVAGNNPTAVAVSPGTQFLYVVNQGDGTVSGFLINPTTGALSLMAGSPFTVGSAPDAIAVDAKGQFVYVANSGSNSISAFTINASTGALTAIAGSPFAMSGGPVSITLDSTQSYVYAYYSVGGTGTETTAASADVAAFSINATTGALTPIAGSPFIIFSAFSCTYPTAVAADPTGNFLYIGFTDTVCSGPASGSFEIESINPSTGVLSAVSSISYAPGPVGSIAIDPAGRFLYVGNPVGGTVFGYAIAASSGLLTRVPGFIQVVDNGIVNSVDPSGHFLYALYPGHESVSFPIDQTTGELGPLTLGPASAMIESFSSTP